MKRILTAILLAALLLTATVVPAAATDLFGAAPGQAENTEEEKDDAVYEPAPGGSLWQRLFG